jgi:hypothetical protein
VECASDVRLGAGGGREEGGVLAAERAGHGKQGGEASLLVETKETKRIRTMGLHPSTSFV